MSAKWVAGSVRARLLARHCVGVDGARDIASAGSVDAAIVRLRASAYGRTSIGADSVLRAQHAVWTTTVWDLRVLAGWLPGAGVGVVRAFAGSFEIENIADRLAFLAGTDEPLVFELGSLGNVSTRVRDAASVHEVREQLRTSPWGDPGSDEREHILMSLRLEWARRLGEIGAAAAWGGAAAALVLARLLVQREEPISPDVRRRANLLGRRALEATSLTAFVAALPDAARWVFDGIDSPEELWRAEAAWWRRVDVDGERLLRAARPGPDVVVGAIARRLVDAWRTCAALEVASRGGRTEELVDVFA